MKFPRNARIFRGQLDAAPFASVFLLLVTFVMLHSLVYTPGVAVQLPKADGLPGIEGPTIPVAVGPNNQFYFQNELISEPVLAERLRKASQQSTAPLTLVVLADKAVTEEAIIHLALLASSNGIPKQALATLARFADKPSGESKP